MADKDIVIFSFSIPHQPAGMAQQDLVKLLGKLMEAKVKLQTISGFVSRQRIKIFCVPENADKFRAFAKSARLRVRDGSGISIAGKS